MTQRTSDKDAALLETLAVRSPSESLPLMLEVVRRQAARRRPADLCTQMARDAFVSPAALDMRTLHRFDGIALDAAEDFEAVLLSPVAPLGCCSVVSPTNQDRAVATVRGTEVVSDPTNVMALECARRLAKDATTDVRLCTVHQVLRPQRFTAKPGFSQHFRLFALAEAGPARAEHGFEVDAVMRHLGVFRRLVNACIVHEHQFSEPRKATLHVSAGASAKAIGERLRARMAATMPELVLHDAVLESGYYDGIRVLFHATTSAGVEVQLGDIGCFDWLAKLTSNRRMRFVAAGLGLQLVPQLFRPAADDEARR